MEKDIKNNLFWEDAKEKIINLFEKIKKEFKHENIISCLEETWVENNLVIIKYKNNRNIPTSITLTILDFKIIIESEDKKEVENFRIIIEACLK
jgi:predicted SnoaL-like aldol condensation-catalyzing enzyme